MLIYALNFDAIDLFFGGRRTVKILEFNGSSENPRAYILYIWKKTIKKTIKYRGFLEKIRYLEKFSPRAVNFSARFGDEQDFEI